MDDFTYKQISRIFCEKCIRYEYFDSNIMYVGCYNDINLMRFK